MGHNMRIKVQAFQRIWWGKGAPRVILVSDEEKEEHLGVHLLGKMPDMLLGALSCLEVETISVKQGHLYLPPPVAGKEREEPNEGIRVHLAQQVVEDGYPVYWVLDVKDGQWEILTLGVGP